MWDFGEIKDGFAESARELKEIFSDSGQELKDIWTDFLEEGADINRQRIEEGYKDVPFWQMPFALAITPLLMLAGRGS